MKTTFFSRIPFSVLLLSITTFSCVKDDDENLNGAMFETVGIASGAQQTPVVSSAGQAIFTGTYNAKSNDWNYSVEWANLNGAATAIELYGPAEPGMHGTLVTGIALPGNNMEGNIRGELDLSDIQETYLLEGRLYYKIITTPHPAGELRGQIMVVAR